MISLTIQRSYQAANKQFAATRAVNGNIGNEFELSIPAAQPGTLTTRTNNTDGTLTMTNSGHGITTGARMDIYWNSGANVAYGATVGTVAGTSVPFTGATGTNLPIATTAITAMVPTSVPMPITGNNMQGLVLYSDYEGTFVLADATPSTKLVVETVSDADAYAWAVGDVGANPLAGLSVTQVFVSHNNPNAASVMRGAMVSN